MSRNYVTEVVKRELLHYQMAHAGFYAKLMMAQRLEGDGLHGLPPGVPLPVLPIAALPAAPKDWVRAAGTFVCPVDTGYGLWFDWTMNDTVNTAVVPSVKGMNPITGQKLEALRLEQYADKCPVHGEPFAHGTLCKKCGYQWPPQNFVSHPNILWLDGFRSGEFVRQFFFSDEDKRDIASLVIGKESTVPAFGFGFWKPKNPRLVERKFTRENYVGGLSGQSITFASYGTGPTGPTGSKGVNGSLGAYTNTNGNNFDSDSVSVNYCSAAPAAQCNSAPAAQCNVAKSPESAFGFIDDDFEEPRGVTKSLNRNHPDRSQFQQKRSKSVSVGAGARISQNLEKDSLGLDGWKGEPEAIIRLYFVFEEQFRELVKSGGVEDLKGSEDGYLKGLPVG
jgi:hypothetical protein